jgi:DNA-binding transcriptional MerR regulator
MDTTAAATQAGVTVSTVRAWCRRGVIAAAKRAGKWVIEAASLAYRISLGARRIDRTREFLDELGMQIDGAADNYATAALKTMLAKARARDTQHLGGVPAGQVNLTDKQWTAIERSISFQIGCLAAEY